MGKRLHTFSGGVRFGTVSIGESTARLGVVVTRGVCDLAKADELFCNRRLTGAVILGRRDEADGQKKLLDDVDHRCDGVFDVKGFRVSHEEISLGLTFNLKEIDVAELAKLSAKEGRLWIESVAEIPVDEDKPDKAERREHIPGTLKAEGPWRAVNLDELFDPAKGIRKALAESGINTVGQLADWSASDKRLTDIKGIGEGKAQEIEDRLVEFWGDNPDAEDEAMSNVEPAVDSVRA